MAQTPTDDSQSIDFAFSVDGALLGELGEKLVPTVHLALAELVKNAYDADATYVELSITQETNNSVRVVIQDDGLGMTSQQVSDYWMRIGTTNKQSNPRTKKYGRDVTGSKGVGRFACRRLGLHLNLQTTAFVQSKGKKAVLQTTQVTFNWNDFKKGTLVESVTHTGTISTAQATKPGTKLEIWGSESDEWGPGGYNYLRRQLALLASNRGQSVEGYETDPGFEIKLKIDNQRYQLDQDIRTSIIDASWGTLAAEVNDQGEAEFALEAKGIRGTKRFTTTAIFTDIKGAHLKIGIFPEDKTEARDPSLLAKYIFSSIVDDWGGVHVRHNGFRMLPYGAPENDWLKLDADRGRRLGKPTDAALFNFAQKLLVNGDPGRSLLNMLGTRNYFGDVVVGSNMSSLVPLIDRQGFLETDGFKQLRAFVRQSIEWATIYRENYITNRLDTSVSKAREAIKPVLDLEVPRAHVVPKAAAFLRNEVRRIVEHLPQREQLATGDTLLKTIKVIEASSKEDAKTLEHLRLVASASTLTFLFAHEVRTSMGTMSAASKRLRLLATKIPKESANLISLADSLQNGRQRLEALVDMTGVMGVLSTSSEAIEINLKKAVAECAQCFELVKHSYGIEIDLSQIPNRVMVGPMLVGELYSIFLNLLSNSIKSLIAAGGAKKKILVQATEVKGNVQVTVMDNGLGLNKEHYSDVFTAFVSDPQGNLYKRLASKANPQDKHVFGAGSGLGLSIVRDILKSRKGDIRFVDPDTGWTCKLELTLP